jgi:hypothetical protein
MSADPAPISLAQIDLLPYIDPQGLLPSQFAGKVGAYAIFAQDQTLQYVGYSRDIYLSLKQHLVRQPQLCHWVKVQVIDRLSRALLEQIRDHWLQAQDSLPPGNDSTQSQWEQPIDVKAAMTAQERADYTDPGIEEITQQKILKNAARRLESEIFAVLEARQIQESLRFNPKLKDNGVLDLK